MIAVQGNVTAILTEWRHTVSPWRHYQCYYFAAVRFQCLINWYGTDATLRNEPNSERGNNHPFFFTLSFFQLSPSLSRGNFYYYYYYYIRVYPRSRCVFADRTRLWALQKVGDKLLRRTGVVLQAALLSTGRWLCLPTDGSSPLASPLPIFVDEKFPRSTQKLKW